MLLRRNTIHKGSHPRFRGFCAPVCYKSTASITYSSPAARPTLLRSATVPLRRQRSSTSSSSAADGAAVGAADEDPLIALLEQQAQQQPTVQVPAEAAAAAAALPTYAALSAAALVKSGFGKSSKQQPTPRHDAADKARTTTSSSTTNTSSSTTAPPLGPFRPATMPFEPMYRQLAAWRARFGVCHVPRHCFDAPQLGAWVRWLRKQKVDGRLRQWQQDRWVRLCICPR